MSFQGKHRHPQIHVLAPTARDECGSHSPGGLLPPCSFPSSKIMVLQALLDSRSEAKPDGVNLDSTVPLCFHASLAVSIDTYHLPLL